MRADDRWSVSGYGGAGRRQALLAARLLVILPTIALALRALGVRRLYRLLHARSERRVARHGLPADPRPADEAPVAEARALAVAVTRFNRERSPIEAKCLTESLALWWLLRRRGIPARLLVGVRTLLGPFESHAWVEYGDQVLNDSQAVRDIFEPFDLGAARRDASRRW